MKEIIYKKEYINDLKMYHVFINIIMGSILSANSVSDNNNNNIDEEYVYDMGLDDEDNKNININNKFKGIPEYILFNSDSFEIKENFKDKPQSDIKSEVCTCILLQPNAIIISSTSDGKIKTWDSKTQTLISENKVHTETISNIIPLPDSKILILTLNTNPIIWNLETKCTEHHLIDKEQKTKKNILCATVLKTKKDHAIIIAKEDENNIITKEENDYNIITGGEDGNIKVWNTQGKCIKTISSNKYAIGGIILTKNNKIVSIAKDYSLKIWDPKSWDCIFEHKGYGYSWTKMNFSYNSDTIAFGSNKVELQNTIQILDTETLICTTQKLITDIKLKSFSMLPDNKIIFNSKSDSNLRIFDLKTGLCEQTIINDNPISTLQYLSYGKILTNSPEGIATIWC